MPKDPIVQVTDAIKASTSLQNVSQLSEAEIEELKALIKHDSIGDAKEYVSSRIGNSETGLINPTYGIYLVLHDLGLISGDITWGKEYFYYNVTARGYWAVERHDLLAEQERLQQELAEKRYQRDRAEDRKIALISAAIGAIATLVTTLATLLATKI